jgi:dipeptidyl aminopeptidase/acylaminoacyl peptidase
VAWVASLYRLRRYLTLTPILVVAGLTGMSTGCFSGGGGGLPSWAKWDDACPAWSPNGKQIAFASNRAAVEASVKVRAASREWGYHYDLFAMNGDGTGVRRLTYLGRTRSVDDSAPVWSEQGRMILFAVNAARARVPE